MAVTAIRMDLGYLARIARQVCLCFVPMSVVPKMLRVRFTFMLAIRSSRCPGELERQADQQENEQQFFHGTNNSIG
jgi:hypothetical protein